MENPQTQTDPPTGRAAGRLSLKAMVLSLLFIVLGLVGTAVYIWVWPIYAQERFLKELEGKGVKFYRHSGDPSTISDWVRKALGFEPPPTGYNGPLVAIGRDRESEVEVLRHLKDVILEISDAAYVEDPIWWLSNSRELTILGIGGVVRDDDLRPLKDLKQLRLLLLSGKGLEGKFLAHLPADTLTDINFDNVHAASKWVEHLGAFFKLKNLHFGSSRLDAAAIRAILELPAIDDLIITESQTQWPEVSEKSASPIKNIWLRKSKVDRSAMKAWARLPKLVGLVLDKSSLDTGALGELSRSESLALIIADNTNVDDAALRQIARIKSLTSIALRGASISHQDLAPLIDMPKLETLRLDRTKLDDRAVEQFVKMAALRDLSLGETAITDKGFEALLGKMKLTDLDVSKTKVTAKGLEALLREHSLETLYVDHLFLSESMLLRIKGAKPDLDITGAEEPDEGEAEPEQPPTPCP